MFGDPYGGWSFGPRYLIPATAVIVPGIGVFLQKWGKNFIGIMMFFSLVGYSVWLATIGAMTTNAIPPKQETMYLATPIPYTYQYNLDFIDKNFSSSLIFNMFLNNQITVDSFVKIYVGLVMVLITILYGASLCSDSKRKININFKEWNIKFPQIKLPVFIKKSSNQTTDQSAVTPLPVQPSVRTIIKRTRRNKK